MAQLSTARGAEADIAIGIPVGMIITTIIITGITMDP
jgi:hypothetical protein